ISLAALLVALVALVIVSLGGSIKEPRDIHLRRYRAVLLPTLPEDPPARDIMGPSAMVESESEGTAPRPDRGAAHTAAPWYGLCAPSGRPPGPAPAALHPGALASCIPTSACPTSRRDTASGTRGPACGVHLLPALYTRSRATVVPRGPACGAPLFAASAAGKCPTA